MLFLCCHDPPTVCSMLQFSVFPASLLDSFAVVQNTFSHCHFPHRHRTLQLAYMSLLLMCNSMLLPLSDLSAIAIDAGTTQYRFPFAMTGSPCCVIWMPVIHIRVFCWHSPGQLGGQLSPPLDGPFCVGWSCRDFQFISVAGMDQIRLQPSTHTRQPLSVFHEPVGCMPTWSPAPVYALLEFRRSYNIHFEDINSADVGIAMRFLCP